VSFASPAASPNADPSEPLDPEDGVVLKERDPRSSVEEFDLDAESDLSDELDWLFQAPPDARFPRWSRHRRIRSVMSFPRSGRFLPSMPGPELMVLYWQPLVPDTDPYEDPDPKLADPAAGADGEDRLGLAEVFPAALGEMRVGADVGLPVFAGRRQMTAFGVDNSDPTTRAAIC